MLTPPKRATLLIGVRGATVLIALLGVCPGCSFMWTGVQNLIQEPIDAHQDACFRDNLRRLAHIAWKDIQCKEPMTPQSEDFAKGFEDGFVDYLYADGTGMPPATVPWHYRFPTARSAPGAAEDWIAGFQQGTFVARQSGYREKLLVPVALPPYQPHAAATKGRQIEKSNPMSPPPDLEPLPLPKQIPGADKGEPKTGPTLPPPPEPEIKAGVP